MINSPQINKELSFFALFCLIFGSMVGSGVFDVPQNIAHSAGVIGISIGWIVTIIGVMSLGLSFVYITNKRPDIQSGIYGYAKHGFGSYVGFNSAWGYLLNAMLACTSYLVLACATLGNFSYFKFLGSGNSLDSLIVQTVVIWFMYALVTNGIKNASFINTIITVVKMTALFIIIVLFVHAFKLNNFISNIYHPASNLGSIVSQTKSTILVAVWSFTGLEAACIFALRAKSIKAVTKATTLGAITICTLGCTISLLPFGIFSGSFIRHLASPSTSGILFYSYGPIFGDCIRGIVILSVMGAMLAWLLIITNLLYVTSLGQTMPKCITTLNKHNVPQNATLTGCLIVQFFVICAFLFHGMYLFIIQLAASLILIPYLLAALFAVKLAFTDKKIEVFALLKGAIAGLYIVWAIYAGGVKFLALSSILYLIGNIFYFKARKDYSEPMFERKWEILLFVLLVVITICTIWFV